MLECEQLNVDDVVLQDLDPGITFLEQIEADVKCHNFECRIL